MVLAAVGQLCSRANILDNLHRCQSIIRRASERGAKMVFLPEASDFIAPPSTYPSLVSSIADSPFVQGVQHSAIQHSCWVSVGVHEKIPDDPKRCYNTSLIISDKGTVTQAYQKLHLFDIDLGEDSNTTTNESRYVAPGTRLCDPCPTPIGKVGQLICYDLRFPEPSIVHRLRGAEIITYPSAFTIRTGGAHWETLLRARAIETQCYVIAAAQVGPHTDDPSGRHSWGHAMLVDPWGTVLARVPDASPVLPPGDEQWSTSFALAELCLDSLAAMRVAMPVLGQRRNDVYPKLD